MYTIVFEAFQFYFDVFETENPSYRTTNKFVNLLNQLVIKEDVYPQAISKFRVNTFDLYIRITKKIIHEQNIILNTKYRTDFDQEVHFEKNDEKMIQKMILEALMDNKIISFNSMSTFLSLMIRES